MKEGQLTMAQRILLCDDEVHILRAAQFKLSTAGYEVQCAYNGLEGWQAIQRQRPNLLVTDLQMPGMNGIELTRKVREHAATRDLPILMLTAKGYELENQELESKWGVMAIMTKPFSPRELLRVVQNILKYQTVGAT
jgi:DNA-binding response OmpR family regulator